MINKLKFINKITAITAAVLMCAALTGCSSQAAEYRDFVFFGMDTYITIRLAANVQDEHLAEVSGECEKIIGDLELILSAHDPRSELYLLNESESTRVSASDTLISAISSALEISELTGGAYDFTLGRLTELWNISGGGPVPAQADIDAAMLHSGWDKIAIDGSTVIRDDAEIKLDLGGIGKGIAADALISYLTSTDVPYGVVSIGGNIGVFGIKPDGEPYKVGIKDPDAPDSILEYIYITEGFVSVSGDYERYFIENGKKYHHILDAATGYPAETDLRSAAVHSKSGAAADALSTALFVMGESPAKSLCANSPLFEAVLITD